MKATARRDGDGYVLNGNKTFITNGPYADTIVFICKLDEPGVEPQDRKILHFVLDKGMPGLTQSKPMRKMGLHTSPTGELFLQDVRVGERPPARRERGARRRRRARAAPRTRSRWSARASRRWRSASSSAASSSRSTTPRTASRAASPSASTSSSS